VSERALLRAGISKRKPLAAGGEARIKSCDRERRRWTAKHQLTGPLTNADVVVITVAKRDRTLRLPYVRRVARKRGADRGLWL